jgi:N-methylhydantoinase A
MTRYLGVDIGGTFTDCVEIDGRGQRRSAKVLTTRQDPERGVLDGLQELATAGGTTLSGLLADSARFAHGTTIGTNAVLERKGARVGLVTTAGHGDALAMMRGGGRVAGLPIERIYEVRGSRRPEPLVERAAVLELHERIDSQGKVVVALDPIAAASRLREFVSAQRLESVAVAFLWSFANDAHERLVGRILADLDPRLYLSLSVDVSPRLGEYERVVATVLNAYVGPASTRYLGRLGARLHDEGLRAPPLTMQSNGGVLPIASIARNALTTLNSGPAGGLVGSAQLARGHGHQNVIATDMGGTSFDIGLIIGGEAVVADKDVIDRYTYCLPRLDVRSVACGGGTIARIDAHTRALRVGPQSAGSEPGPICYGRGGKLPTVTDADVVLGLVRPQTFLGGRMPLDERAARDGIGELAARLGLAVEATAAGIVNVNNACASGLIRQRTLECGLDPRDFVLYAYGGAGPVHAFGFAGELGVREVIIPLGNGASTLSAYGTAATDLTRYIEKERLLPAPFDPERLAATVAEIGAEAELSLRAAGATGTAEVRIWALMRFREQLMHRLEVAIDLPVDAERLRQRFADEYRVRYGAGALSLFQAIEIFAFRARGRVPSGVAATAPSQTTSRRAPDPIATAQVFWPTTMEHSAAAVYDGTQLEAGHTIAGPALVELPYTTTPVAAGQQLSVLPSGSQRLTSLGGAR